MKMLYLTSCLVAVLVAVSEPLPCNSCSKKCATTPSNLTACNCDADCGVFGDCCNSHDPPSSCPADIPELAPVPTMECQSTFLNSGIKIEGPGEAFMMVTSCPDSNVLSIAANCTSLEELAGNCTAQEELAGSGIASNGLDTNCIATDCKQLVTRCEELEAAAAKCISLIESLQPVTDVESGLVYKNEYYARCHGVTTMLAWQQNLVCTRSPLDHSPLTSLLQIKNFLSTHCQACAYQPPPSSPNVYQPRSCLPTLRSCLNKMDLEDFIESPLDDSLYADLVETCLNGPLDPISILEESTGTVYHNSGCARCNYYPLLTNASVCVSTLAKRAGIPKLCIPRTNIIVNPAGSVLVMIPFTITLSNLGGGQILLTTTTAGEARVTLDCSKGQAPVGLECRDTQCPEGFSQTGGRCASTSTIGGETLDDSVIEGNTTKANDTGMSNQNLDDTMFLDCPTALLALNDSEFEDRGNNTIFHDGELIKVLYYDSNGHPLICPDNTTLVSTNWTTTNLALLPGIGYLTYIGCSLSVLGSALVLLTYGLFRELRTLPSLLLMNLCVALLIANLLYIIGGPIVQYVPSTGLCIGVAICIHFFTLVQFAWMTLFSIETAYTFYLAKNLVRVEDRSKYRALLFYMCAGWGLPGLICVTTITLNFSGRGLVLYGVTSDGSVGSCWINHFLSFVLSFLVPMVASLLINLTMFVVAMAFLCLACRSKSRQRQTNFWLLVRVWVALFITTGMTWVLGFLAIPDQTSVIWYPFVVFNSTQGLAISLVFLGTKKIFTLYFRLFTCKPCSPKAKPENPPLPNKPVRRAPSVRLEAPTFGSTETIL